jgi:tricorn protease
VFRFSLLTSLLLASLGLAKEPIRLANRPALSPDGKTLAFDWQGDIWSVPTGGGLARPLTTNAAKDTNPKFSPDGKEIAFLSDREGTPQIYVMPASGGTPTRMTFNTSGYTLYEWTPDGKGWLVGTQRDHGWGRRNNDRLQIVRRWNDEAKRPADELLFDDYAANGTLSPDGKKILFTREGPEWWRKGYRGSQSSQIWSYDLNTKAFDRLNTGDWDARWPMWGPQGQIYYTQASANGFNLWQYDAANKTGRPLTNFPDDSTVFPAISRDGSTIVFRHLFDFYRFSPSQGGAPTKIEIFHDDDRPQERVERKVLTSATAAAFTNDGLEIAIIAGGDLWVMDTELREPKRITFSPEEDRQPIFSPDQQSIYFISDAGGKPEIWRVKKPDAKKPWFLNEDFKPEALTNDGQEKANLSFSPEGSKLAYVKGRGDLVVADLEGKNEKVIVPSWNAPDYDWSPDGKWFVYAVYDNDFNRDIWIKPLDGSKPPFNLSRHPYNESNPVWSPDGKLIAYVGARDEKDNIDIHYVWLQAQDNERSNRDRTLDKALEKFRRPTGPTPFPKKENEGEQEPPTPKKDDPAIPPKKEGAVPPKKGPVEVVIDFDGIYKRIKRVSIPNSSERNLLWSPDSKKLAFSGSIEGQTGTFTIEIPDNLRPTQISPQSGSDARWLRNGSIVWLVAGRPASFVVGSAAPSLPTLPSVATGGGGRGPRAGGGGPAAGSPSPAGGYAFTAYQDIDAPRKNQAAFDMAWRTMRDNWYDDRLGNRDWKAIREKYRGMAETSDADTLATVIQMMLGELNGSHLGFFAGSMTLPSRRGLPPEEPTADRSWRLGTPHLGVRFDPSYGGRGWKVRDVLPEGPADQKKSKLNPGDIIIEVDGKPVDPALDPTLILNGPPNREFRLKVKDPLGKEREVSLRPTTYALARQLLYEAWLRDNREMVEKLSNGKLGYLHISAMDMPSFHKFEEALYDAGAGKDGLIIDVRENGGGSTADLLLTALTQPQHAIAVPRDGGQGYPQDRTVFATWNKPILVLCNQNSFSNAEIFSHAVKTLKRGKVVGVPTAGGVVSTGGTPIMDVGFLRVPFRGWYLVDSGEDMELHGAVPDVIVWPQPGEAAKGKDSQIEKGVELLLKDVEAWKNRPQPKLKKATERKP